MSRRSKRRIILDEKSLEKLGEGRSVVVAVASRARIGSPEYRAAQETLDAIDDLAGKLTGDRRYYVNPLAKAGTWSGPSCT
ncbi:hypothetical protein [uncultured Roseibium sp.]|uniref:hypothetical protein n=1 Tax=uncultured Roseibium sp. TaxID=1936171 RepID=UPI0026206CC4|nr:hypothetical protein [uncultured Roseibium sp.]